MPTFSQLFTFNGLLTLVAVGGIIGVSARYRLRHVVPLAWPFDTCLAALVGAVAGARLLHVALNAPYFAASPAEIARLSAGGLNWHGAVIGGVVAFALMIRWRRLDSALMWDSAAWVLPFVALAAWWGCGAAYCGYGAEVATLADYPSWLVWEARDLTNTVAPRFAVQRLGVLLALAVLIALAVVVRRGWLIGQRFPFVLALSATGLFALGFLRGDYSPVWGVLRADQWLDLVLLGVSIVPFLRRGTR